MGNRYSGEPISVAAVGKQLASGAASANFAIPLNASGQVPVYVRVAATVPACIKFGPAGVVATVNDAQIQPGDSEKFCVNGNTYFAVIQVSAAGLVNVVPLENA